MKAIIFDVIMHTVFKKIFYICHIQTLNPGHRTLLIDESLLEEKSDSIFVEYQDSNMK